MNRMSAFDPSNVTARSSSSFAVRDLFRKALRRAATVGALAALALSLFAPAGARAATRADSPLSPEAFRVRQEMQQRARDMAKELVSTMLDVQIKQLEQNGLQKLDIYKDIKTMRTHIDGLVEADMRNVVAILVEAQKAEPEKRVKYYADARKEIRTIVTKLAVERQNLARRLRIAELTAQVKMLIEKQTGVRRTTESLTDEQRQTQAELTLDTIHNQRDVRALFVQLVNALSDVSTWGGQVGAGASDGIRILKAGQAGKELDNASTNLESAHFATTVKSQTSVINTLKALLDKLEGIQGLINSSNEEALAMVRDLEKREAEIRKETKQADLTDKAAEELVDRQTEVRKDLSKLNAALERVPSAEAPLQQAKAAAEAARGDLFDAKKNEAIDQETKTLGNLAEIEKKLEQAGDQQTGDKSAAELAQEVKNLEAAQKEVAQAKQEEQKAAEETKAQPQAAAQEDQKAAEALAKAAEPTPLPEAVKSRVADAQEAAKEAAAAEANPAAAPAAKEAAQAAAQEATERAAAEIAAALNDAKLDQKAVSAGELARAAEALERAAAAEQQIAQETAAAAKDQGLKAADAQKLAADQAEVKQVAEKIAEGVKDRAPDAAAQLDAAKAPIADTAHDLAAAQKDPGAATKPADADAAAKANDAAAKLANAAADLRKEVAAEAGQLAQIADEQLKPVVEARKNVEAEQAKQPESPAAALEKLNQAEQKVAQAAADQQRAEGKPQAAAALDLAAKIAEVQHDQQAADQAAHDLAQGKSDSSFDATTAEQKVAEAAADVNKEAAARPQAESGAKDRAGTRLGKGPGSGGRSGQANRRRQPASGGCGPQRSPRRLGRRRENRQGRGSSGRSRPANRPTECRG